MDMRFDGTNCNKQIFTNFLIALSGKNQPENLRFSFGQFILCAQIRHLIRKEFFRRRDLRLIKLSVKSVFYFL